MIEQGRPWPEVRPRIAFSLLSTEFFHRIRLKFRYNLRHDLQDCFACAESAPVPANVQTCQVWIRFSSAWIGRLPDFGEPFFVAPSPAIAPGPSPIGQGEIIREGKMEIKQLTEEMNNLVRSKGWYESDSKRPQTPRNIAISLAVEAAEILEHYQFRENARDTGELAGELADVALYLLQLASVTGIDLEKAILDKIEVNKTREWDQE
jgi:NTP pyrophosphatase (non-canonical NTP hydrolase)